jgi:hypothetical protein
MIFEDLRKDIELKISSIAEFELQEFHFSPYSFGSGLLLYRKKTITYFNYRNFKLKEYIYIYIYIYLFSLGKISKQPFKNYKRIKSKIPIK